MLASSCLGYAARVKRVHGFRAFQKTGPEECSSSGAFSHLRIQPSKTIHRTVSTPSSYSFNYPDIENLGEVTLEDFKAFAQKKTWGQDNPSDPFSALLGATGNIGGTMTNGVISGKSTPGAESDVAEESDSEGEDAR